ncbi:MAG: cell division protein FtsL [Thermodesulfobacteriota bacterium]
MARTTISRATQPGILEIQSIRIRRDLKDTGFFYGSVIVVAFVALVFFAYLQMRLTVVKLGYEISSANTERAKLTDLSTRLKLEQAGLRAPERIERIAREELGLAYPTLGQVKRIR